MIRSQSYSTFPLVMLAYFSNSICNAEEEEALDTAGEEASVPLQLPPNPVPLNQMRKHYSLPIKERQKTDLQLEMTALIVWVTSPDQLDRDGKPYAARSLENLMVQVYLFLGFAFFYCGHRALSLQLFLDLQLFAKFMAYQKAKGNKWNTLSQSIQAAKKILSYLGRTSAATSLMHKIRVQQAVKWMTNLFRNQRRVMYRPKTDTGTLEQQGEWLDAATIVQLINKFKQTVVASMPVHSSLWCRESARQLHDLVLMCMMFGYLPPIRLIALRHMQLPTSMTCFFPSCPYGVGCKGNRFEQRGDDMWLVMSHYKVDSWYTTVLLVLLSQLHLFLL